MSAVKVQWAVRHLDDTLLIGHRVRLPYSDGQWSDVVTIVAVCTYWGGRTVVTYHAHRGLSTVSLSPALAQRGALVEATP